MKRAIELDASFREQPRFERYETAKTIQRTPSDEYLQRMRRAGFDDPREYDRATLKSGFPHWSDEFIEEILDRGAAESLPG